MKSALDKAIAEWKSEVDAEMVKLIETGMPPYKAVSEASNIVSRRKRAAKMDYAALRYIGKR